MAIYQTVMFCPHSTLRADQIRKRRAEIWFPGMWVLGEVEERQLVGALL